MSLGSIFPRPGGHIVDIIMYEKTHFRLILWNYNSAFIALWTSAKPISNMPLGQYRPSPCSPFIYMNIYWKTHFSFIVWNYKAQSLDISHGVSICRFLQKFWYSRPSGQNWPCPGGHLLYIDQGIWKRILPFCW
jgi:hypothetical protein